MEGTCVVPMPPMIVAMDQAPADKSLDLNAATLMPVCCAPMSCTLRAKDAGKLGEVIDVAAGLDHLQHAAAAHRRALLIGERVAAAIAVLVAQEVGAIFGAVEGKAHAVQRQALLRLRAIEDGCPGDVLLLRRLLLGALQASSLRLTLARLTARALICIKCN